MDTFKTCPEVNISLINDIPIVDDCVLTWQPFRISSIYHIYLAIIHISYKKYHSSWDLRILNFLLHFLFEHRVLRIGYTKAAFLCSSLNHAGAVAVCITQTIHSWQGIDCLSQIWNIKYGRVTTPVRLCITIITTIVVQIASNL